MIQHRLNDKEKDIQGLKKQTSSLLNCAWEKGYVAGFDDGYKTGRQAEEQLSVVANYATAERPQTIGCFNCKHYNKEFSDYPCCNCNKHFCKWEEKGGERE